MSKFLAYSFIVYSFDFFAFFYLQSKKMGKQALLTNGRYYLSYLKPVDGYCLLSVLDLWHGQAKTFRLEDPVFCHAARRRRIDFVHFYSDTLLVQLSECWGSSWLYLIWFDFEHLRLRYLHRLFVEAKHGQLIMDTLDPQRFVYFADLGQWSQDENPNVRMGQIKDGLILVKEVGIKIRLSWECQRLVGSKLYRVSEDWTNRRQLNFVAYTEFDFNTNPCVSNELFKFKLDSGVNLKKRFLIADSHIWIEDICYASNDLNLHAFNVCTQRCSKISFQFPLHANYNENGWTLNEDHVFITFGTNKRKRKLNEDMKIRKSYRRQILRKPDSLLMNIWLEIRKLSIEDEKNPLYKHALIKMPGNSEFQPFSNVKFNPYQN